MTAPSKGHTVIPAGDEARLEALLQAYGRNPLRWPDADRTRFAHLVRAPHLLPQSAAGEAHHIDRMLDLAGAAATDEPAGARARLMQRISREPQAVDDVTAPPPFTGVRALLAAGMMAASIAIGTFVGLGTEAVPALADALQVPVAGDDVLDVVLAVQAEYDGGVL